ncbi:glycosyltransferase family 2 protein [Natronococcus sp. A-GB1]|uniref:glycosyltransferase n=1 Tax=Natronococcus sp. A-GB1 TaxID=3037648 RepID=UPI00241F8FB3|nr:glycosyltransferase family 2 protein [Natronococcus sp. A-GB1]MDG5759050.1 glycosyltransferase family 2 protein [Natronococcus sp. A-GB1]
MVSRLRGFVWYAAVASMLAGIVGKGAGWEAGSAILIVGGTVLGGLTIAAAWLRTRYGAVRPVGGVAALVGGPLVLFVSAGITGGVLPPELSISQRMAALALGVQAFLFAINVHPLGASRSTRWLVPVTGHTTMFAGMTLVLGVGPFDPSAALIMYATGFASLILHTFWMRQIADDTPPEPDTMSRWEAGLLISLIVGLIGAAATGFTVPAGELTLPSPLARSAAVAAGGAAVLSFGILGRPPSPPDLLEPLTGTVVTVLKHGATLIILLNALLLAVFLVATPVFVWAVVAFLGWLLLVTTIEYLQTAYAHRRRQRPSSDPPSLSEDPPVTVVVTAAFEADVLPESLSTNLEVLDGLPFLVVPAAKSDDGTVAIAREYAATHDRLRVVEGTSGSKAGDLNQAWSHVNTPYALILDADETIGLESVARGVEILRERSEVGVVQGRKAASHPGTDAFSRYVSVERQHSTWIDHPFMDDIFGAGHFGGSIALFRREVPRAVDGWDPDALTEDIDFTLRLYSETDWVVEYTADMVGWELHPATVRALVRQRVRWARGWVQASIRHFGDILRSRRELGWRRTLGIEWLLFTSISAPVSTVFPILMILWFVGFAPPLPLYAAIALGLFMLPARVVSFGYAALCDPEIPFPTTPKRVGEVIAYANLWVLFGWFVQLHALYLQLAGAPRLWYVTEKSTE